MDRSATSRSSVAIHACCGWSATQPRSGGGPRLCRRDRGALRGRRRAPHYRCTGGAPPPRGRRGGGALPRHPAVTQRARDLLRVERWVGLDLETWLIAIGGSFLLLLLLRLVRHFARRFSNRGEPFDDLLQVGMLVDKTGHEIATVERGELDQEQHDAVRDVFYAPGGCTLVRADLFQNLGGREVRRIEISRGHRLAEERHPQWLAVALGILLLCCADAFLTLTFLEVVLGVDNVIFISILVGKLPKEQQQRGRTLGLGGAMVMRILLLLSLTWIMRTRRLVFAVAILLLPWVGLDVYGCQCREREPPCAQYSSADAVFIGLVANISFSQDKSKKSIHFNVERAFRGVSSSAAEIVTLGTSMMVGSEVNNNLSLEFGD